MKQSERGSIIASQITDTSAAKVLFPFNRVESEHCCGLTSNYGPTEVNATVRDALRTSFKLTTIKDAL